MLMHLAQALTESCADPNGVLLLPPFDADPLRQLGSVRQSKPRGQPARKGVPMVTMRIRRPQADGSETSSVGSVRQWPPSAPPPPSPPPPPPLPSPPPDPDDRILLTSFADLFDVDAFERLMAPHCLARQASRESPMRRGRRQRVVLSGDPPPGARVVGLQVLGLNNHWNSTQYSPMLAAIYASLRPSSRVERLVRTLLDAAEARAGPRWAAVHLPIEKDWWYGSSWCFGRSHERYTKRCYSPAEAAAATQHARRNTTGAVLLYAHDKVATRANPLEWRPSVGGRPPRPVYGPLICKDAFGPKTFKLQLPSSVPYLYRNAAEQLLAARAPGGFFGNSFSTFSKSVALLRSNSPPRDNPPREGPRRRDAGDAGDVGRASTAYDCAQWDFKYWRTTARRGIVPLHPGFWALSPLYAEGGRSEGGDEVTRALTAHDKRKPLVNPSTATNAPFHCGLDFASAHGEAAAKILSEYRGSLSTHKPEQTARAASTLAAALTTRSGSQPGRGVAMRSSAASTVTGSSARAHVSPPSEAEAERSRSLLLRLNGTCAYVATWPASTAYFTALLVVPQVHAAVRPSSLANPLPPHMKH